MRRTLLLAALAAAQVGTGAHGQDAAREVEHYRQMLKADPWSNPGLLEADRGAALWKERRGPRHASLEACDLGKGGMRPVLG
jgi:sulfur-oxidizing protein SoxA